MLTLYQGRTAVCAVKVRLVLAEKGLEWTPRDLDLRAGEQHRPDYLKLNPAGVVPTLVHDDRVLTESSVIMLYLDELRPEPRLQPDDAFERARMRLWMKRADEVIHPGNTTLTYAAIHRKTMMARTPEERNAHYERIPNPGRRELQRRAIEEGLESRDVIEAVAAFRQCMTDMEAALAGGPWLAGRQWTLADAAMTPYLDRLEAIGLGLLWRPEGAVADWLERIRARPSFAEAVTRFAPPPAPPHIDETAARALIERAAA